MWRLDKRWQGDKMNWIEVDRNYLGVLMMVGVVGDDQDDNSKWWGEECERSLVLDSCCMLWIGYVGDSFGMRWDDDDIEGDKNWSMDNFDKDSCCFDPHNNHDVFLLSSVHQDPDHDERDYNHDDLEKSPWKVHDDSNDDCRWNEQNYGKDDNLMSSDKVVGNVKNPGFVKHRGMDQDDMG